jgi:hypothetical protein
LATVAKAHMITWKNKLFSVFRKLWYSFSLSSYESILLDVEVFLSHKEQSSADDTDRHVSGGIWDWIVRRLYKLLLLVISTTILYLSRFTGLKK